MSDAGRVLPRLGIRWAFTDFSGWGVFGTNLARDLARRELAIPVPLYIDDLLADGTREDPLLAPALTAQREMAPRLAAEQQIGRAHV